MCRQGGCGGVTLGLWWYILPRARERRPPRSVLYTRAALAPQGVAAGFQKQRYRMSCSPVCVDHLLWECLRRSGASQGAGVAVGLSWQPLEVRATGFLRSRCASVRRASCRKWRPAAVEWDGRVLSATYPRMTARDRSVPQKVGSSAHEPPFQSYLRGGRLGVGLWQ